MFMPIEQKTCFILMFCQINNIGGRGNTPIINDRNMGKIGTMSQSNPVTAHGIFNMNIIGKYLSHK